jgi:hypothetical protein
VVKLVKRPPDGKQFKDLTGQKFGPWLTAVKYIGFLDVMAAWEFSCDCGGTKISRGAHVAWAARRYKAGDTSRKVIGRLHCGCQNINKKHGMTETPEYDMWSHMRHKLCDRWRKDILVFIKECLSSKTTHRYLIAPDDTKLIGPDNFQWSSQCQSYHNTVNEVLDLLVAQGRDRETESKRLRSVSKQRVYQLQRKLTGRCSTCGAERNMYATYCDECQDKINTYTRSRTGGTNHRTTRDQWKAQLSKLVTSTS